MIKIFNTTVYKIMNHPILIRGRTIKYEFQVILQFTTIEV